eukprot:TRINITY_DN350_c0_g1_i1.p1 TRINITY_DN350_c0_g1~~TRINITY_DN350_c0_g1_i1.p1  ORF type:complete len:112 (-),score=33.19 TRINITY_DN350_c0_g1_i1:101-436(-)
MRRATTVAFRASSRRSTCNSSILGARYYCKTSGAPTNNNPNQSRAEIEQEKQKNLKGETKSNVKSAPGWNEKLGSTSEAVIKSEKDDQKSVKQLQNETVEHLHGDKKGQKK